MSATVEVAADQPADAAFPALRRLGLADEQLAALRRQGYLDFLNGVDGRRYWRLRVRSDGMLRTYYIGYSPQRLADVQQELELLRAPRKAIRHATETRRLARQAMREVRTGLVRVVQANGFHFHGLATIRRWRWPKLTGGETHE